MCSCRDSTELFETSGNKLVFSKSLWFLESGLRIQLVCVRILTQTRFFVHFTIGIHRIQNGYVVVSFSSVGTDDNLLFFGSLAAPSRIGCHEKKTFHHLSVPSHSVYGRSRPSRVVQSLCARLQELKHGCVRLSKLEVVFFVVQITLGWNNSLAATEDAQLSVHLRLNNFCSLDEFGCASWRPRLRILQFVAQVAK